MLQALPFAPIATMRNDESKFKKKKAQLALKVSHHSQKKLDFSQTWALLLADKIPQRTFPNASCAVLSSSYCCADPPDETLQLTAEPAAYLSLLSALKTVFSM